MEQTELNNIKDQLNYNVISYPVSYDLKNAGLPQKAEYHYLVPRIGSISLIHQSELDKYFCAANTTYAAFTIEELSQAILNKFRRKSC